MKVAVLGGGPAGLYFAYRFKRARPHAQVDLFEQNPAGATWGFGVVFSDRALEFLRADDPETVELISARMETWRDITVAHRGEAIAIDGVGFSAIGRLELLRLLQARVDKVGVRPRYETIVRSIDEFAGYDLIVAADGVNSLVRRGFEGDFKTSVTYLDNKFAWFGTTKRFDTLTQTFVTTPLGASESSGGAAGRSKKSSPYGSSSRIGTPKRVQMSTICGRRSAASVLPVGFS